MSDGRNEDEPEKRIFTLAEARALLPDVKRICGSYKEKLEELQAEMQSGRPMVEREVRALLQDWTEEIEALGAEPKGIWLVDFDSGDGFYYCWQWGEDEIAHVHEYEAGFAGRRPIKS